METEINSKIIDTKKNIIVLAESEEFYKEASELAAHLNADVTIEPDKAENYDLIMKFGSLGLILTDRKLEMQGDFTKLIPRLRRGNLQGEFLVKAAKIKGENRQLTVVDATAGLGEDSFILAAAGFHVKLYEYDPVIAALLKDSLKRAGEISELADIVSRMEVFEENSMSALPNQENPPDIILLDPMFPERQKSALVKKKFQLIHHLEKPCDDEEGLVKAAIAANPRKIIIKRPLKGPFLAGIKPSYSIKGKAIRYDCLIFAR